MGSPGPGRRGLLGRSGARRVPADHGGRQDPFGGRKASRRHRERVDHGPHAATRSHGAARRWTGAHRDWIRRSARPRLGRHDPDRAPRDGQSPRAGAAQAPRKLAAALGHPPAAKRSSERHRRRPDAVGGVRSPMARRDRGRRGESLGDFGGRGARGAGSVRDGWRCV